MSKFTKKIREEIYDEIERQGSILQDATISIAGDRLLIQGNLEIDLKTFWERLHEPK